MKRTILPGRFQIQSQVGQVTLSWNDRGQLQRLDLLDPSPPSVESEQELPALIRGLVIQVRGYLDQGIPISPLDHEFYDQSCWTEFQKQVYEAVAAIPYGETRTYGWVAQRLSKWGATRAVGQALRKNPLPIVIPCHRVVSMNSIGGFMGILDPEEPELVLKKKLIGLEEEYRNPFFGFCKNDSQVPFLLP